MVTWYIRKEPCEDRAEQARQKVYRTGLLAYAHHSEP